MSWAVSKLAAMAAAMTVAKGVSNDILYFYARWCNNEAIDLAIATNLNTGKELQTVE